MFNDTSVGIRSPKEILTFAETVNDSESFNWGDFSREDAKRALKKGTITVYSSYPIKNGVFVSTSYRAKFHKASLRADIKLSMLKTVSEKRNGIVEWLVLN